MVEIIIVACFLMAFRLSEKKGGKKSFEDWLLDYLSFKEWGHDFKLIDREKNTRKIPQTKEQAFFNDAEKREQPFNWDAINLAEKGNFPIFLLGIYAFMIKADNKIKISELRHFDSVLDIILAAIMEKHSDSTNSSNMLLQLKSIMKGMLKSMLDSNIPIKQLLHEANIYLDVQTKKHILCLMWDMAYSDWKVDAAEGIAIKNMGNLLGFSEEESVKVLDNNPSSGIDIGLLLDELGSYEELHDSIKESYDMSITKVPNKRLEMVEKNPDLVKSFDTIMQASKESSLKDKLGALEDTRPYNQYLEMERRSERFQEVLDERLASTELAYQRYNQLFKVVYGVCMSNFNHLYLSLRMLESINVDRIERRLSDPDIDTEKSSQLKARLAKMEDAKQEVNKRIMLNERALQEMEEVSIKLAQLKGNQVNTSQLVEEAMKEMNLLKEQVKLYNT